MSKPGPRFALVAGTRTSTRRPIGTGPVTWPARGVAATASTSTGTTVGLTSPPSAVRSAHCGSLSPCPVTVSTTVASRGTAPASARSSRPATLIAEAGSTKMPTSADRMRWAARIASSSIAPKYPSLSSWAASGELPGRRVADPDRGGDRVRVLHDLTEHDRCAARSLEPEHARQPAWWRRRRGLRA